MRLASLLAAIVAALLALPRPAEACGPFFPPDFLSDRASTLTELIDGLFLVEAGRLVPPPQDGLRAVEGEEEEPGARDGGGPRETELYRTGAESFHQGRFAEAAERFREVLALPEKERRRFSTFAEYMLGRLADSPEEARRHYAEVRALAAKGFDDPLGLAVASLGQEGRLALDADDLVRAISRYAQQAASGSQSGATSLLFVARRVTGSPELLERVLADRLGQRLVATFAWTRANELTNPTALLERLAQIPDLAGADRLAAAAWRRGRFELAERFAGKVETPLALWVRAKLAARRGDRGEAERWLAKAADGVPQDDMWADEVRDEYPVRGRIEGERAVLSLSRGDFQGTFEHVLASCAWADIAYVAERLLTIDELKARLERGGLPPCEYPGGVTRDLEAVLGRRLLRAGRDTEALAWFQSKEMAEKARSFVAARAESNAAKDPLDRAEALFRLARLARTDGMEVLGTESGPDWAMFGGGFQVGLPSECPPPAGKGALPFPLQPPAECERFTANAPAHESRFHYRAIAADLAEQAAALVPPRSQAFAALLCTAAGFVASTDRERVQRLWSTYVARGSCLVEDMNFPNQCPEPNFEKLRNPPSKPLALAKKRTWRKRDLAPWAGGGILLVGAAIPSAILLRRSRKRTPKG